MLRRPAMSLLVLLTVSTLAAADPARWKQEGWSKTDFAKSKVAFEEILSGGPPRDGIPPIDAPLFKPIAEVAGLGASEPVIGLVIGGDARAYPLRILTWHEIVNDVVGGTPVAVTYCPLCNAALVFDRRIDGRVLDFGTTGKLRNSDLVMYDRQTESWWQQFTGEAIIGELAGTVLKLVPARLESLAEFRAREPGGKVLVPANPRFRPYGTNPYVGYDTTRRPFLYRGELPSGIAPMARVVVIRRDKDKPLIIAVDKIRRTSPFKIASLELTWQPGQSSALDSEDITKGRDVGTVVAYEVAADGSRKLVPHDVTFAFVAHAFHPDVAIDKD